MKQMTVLSRWGWALLASLLVTAGAWGQATAEKSDDATGTGVVSRGQITALKDDAVVRSGEEADEVVVVLGDARIDGKVRGDVVVVFGSAEITGRVDGDLTVVMGSAKLGPNAAVDGGVHVVGGRLDADPRARIRSERVVVPVWPGTTEWRGLRNWLAHGVAWGRPMAPSVGWCWLVAGVFALVYLLIGVMLPGPLQSCFEACEERPIGSFFTGILAFILIGPVLFLLCVSVVGILAIPFLICAVIASVFFGKAAVCRYAGYRLRKQFNPDAGAAPLISLLSGLVIFCLIYLIPVLGMVFWGVTTLVGFGAAVQAAMASFRREGDRAGGGSGPTSPIPTVSLAAAAAAGPGGTGEGSSFASISLAPGVAAAPAVILAPRVGFWPRFAASLLDLLLIFWPAKFFGPSVVLVWIAYCTAMWAWKGTTVGGIVVGLKVVRLDGRPVDFGVAAVRALSAILSAMPMFIGFFWASWSAEKQSWHDKIAGTTIVRVPKGMSLI